MFARAVRPAARAARQIPLAPARRLISSGPRPHPTEPEHGKNLVLLTGAVAALVTAGSVARELRTKHVHPSEPKEEEEVVEEEAEAGADAESEDATMVEAAVESAKDKVEHAFSAADAALHELIAEAESALGIAAAPKASDTDALAAEAASQGAFNEETGEINWDCPCLGGMATGPCGEEFKAAFSCFVYSEAEPKGIDCVEKFKAMQDCFREHPDVYGEEEDEDEAAAEPPAEKN